MLNESARGVYVILVTPFDERGALDLDGTERLINFYADGGKQSASATTGARGRRRFFFGQQS